jgi:hypothetical protein
MVSEQGLVALQLPLEAQSYLLAWAVGVVVLCLSRDRVRP